tara:strand:+ start:23 stop:751 length:729 start_codon:yes stop_codon:yes gene_type:complete
MNNKSQLNHYGYCVLAGNNESFYSEYTKYVEMFRLFIQKGLSDFKQQSIHLKSLGQYHQVLKENNIDTHAFISSLEKKRKLPDEFLNNRFVQLLLDRTNKELDGDFKINNNDVWFRVCRPSADDSNDLHRDTWFSNYKGLLNYYIPVSGSFVDSAMKIVPFSHKWTNDEVKPSIPEGDGKYLKNGIAYSACTIGYCKYDIKPHRPDVPKGSVMIFDPNMIHGGGDNYSPETRFSFEIRIEKK